MKVNEIIVTVVDGTDFRINLETGRVEIAGQSYPLQVAAGSGQGDFEDDEDE